MTQADSEPDSTTPDVAAGKANSGFPKAELRRTRASIVEILRGSKLWWLTLVCLVIAIGLVWAAIPERGPVITIHFPDGHGLRIGDALRHRGIDIGTVSDVMMNEKLDGVTVQAELQPSAEAVAREGSRFWIVRPQIGIEGISGLETAVGSKYIEVSPAEPGSLDAVEFDGLPTAPPDELAPDGLRLVLRSSHRHGLTPGAPVTWRGVEVGQVLSVSLSPDARYVDASVRIDGQFRRLVQSSSKFWVNSGLNVDVGLTGVSVAAESLTTLTKGGVAFITPSGNANDQTVKPGQIFPLAAEPDTDWLIDADHVPLVDVSLPNTVTVKLSVTKKTLLVSHGSKVESSGFVIAAGGSSPQGRLVIPAPPASAKLTDPIEVEVTDSGRGTEQVSAPLESAAFMDGLLLIPLTGQQLARAAIPIVMIDSGDWPQACGAVRSVADPGGRPASVMLSIGEHEMQEADGRWTVTTEGADSETWHGAPVVALEDGKIVGLLIATGDGAYIQLLDAAGFGG